jgi:hypothetical protein
VIVRSAYLAAAEKCAVTRKHVDEACELECRQAGRLFKPAGAGNRAVRYRDKERA